jgi:hypothetical protein
MPNETKLTGGKPCLEITQVACEKFLE